MPTLEYVPEIIREKEPKMEIRRGLEMCDLKALIDFEKKSWPEGEQASEEVLKERLEQYPEGFFTAWKDGVIVGQTFWKRLTSEPESFKFDSAKLPVDKAGNVLWGVNLAVLERGKSVGEKLIQEMIKFAKEVGVKKISSGLRVPHMKEWIENGKIKTADEYPLMEEGVMKAFKRAAEKENVNIEFSSPIPNYWEVDEESLGYASKLTIYLEEEVIKKPQPLTKTFSEIEKFDGRELLYIILGYHRGCARKCEHCGMREVATPDQTLKELGFLNDDKSTEAYGKKISSDIKREISSNSVDSVVLLNGGNIIDPREMYPETIMEDIPAEIRKNARINQLEIEVRVDDVIRNIDKLNEIQKNLGEKKLVVRLPIEYANDNQLKITHKGVSVIEIEQAIKILNDNNIEWTPYIMFGGVGLNKNTSKDMAFEAALFAIEKGAKTLIINSQFITYSMKNEGVFVPSLSDLIKLVREIKNSANVIKIKTSIGADKILGITKKPRGTEEEEEKLKRFNETQNINDLS